MRAGVPRFDGDRALQQVARVGVVARGLLHECHVDDRFDVAWFYRQRNAELAGRRVEPTGAHQGDAQIVVRPDVLWIDGDRLLKLLHRNIELSAIGVQQTEIVVHLRARVVLPEQRAVVQDGVIKVASPLVVQRQAEMIDRRR